MVKVDERFMFAEFDAMLRISGLTRDSFQGMLAAEVLLSMGLIGGGKKPKREWSI